MNAMRKLGVQLAGVVISATLAGQAWGSLINVDFNSTTTQPEYTYPPSGTYSGTAASTKIGTYWNGLGIGAGFGSNPTFTSGALTTSDGVTPTTATVTINGPFGVIDVQGQYNVGAGVAQALLNDFAYDLNGTTPPPVSFSIDNLPTGKTFNLFVYSGGGSFGNSSSFTIGSTTLAISGGPFASFDDATTDGIGNYLVFSNLTESAGSIAGTFTGSNNRFSGFQLEIIPEPSTALLFGVGGVLLWFKRRQA